MNARRTFASPQEAAPYLNRALHLAIGMFDGVHRGHQVVINGAIAAAHRQGGLSAVLTFWPHPSRLFTPDNPVRQLQSPAYRERRLFSLGLDAVITQPFTREFASIPADRFLSSLKEWLPTLCAIYVGDNWRFGKGRTGDVPFLQEDGARLGIDVVSTARMNADGDAISSSRIRSLLVAGDIAEVNALLGYNYFSEGVVVPGKKLGRTLGFPTLNLTWNPDLPPRFGVYAVRLRDAAQADGMWFPAVANYGLRPTVEQATEPRLEAHLIGQCNFDAGDRLIVEWLAFLRPEKRFETVDQLKAQIAADRDRCITHFASHSGA